MKYVKFVIENYRAIEGPLEVPVGKAPLIPIIGVNECGKTTILQALFAFDHHNDAQNSGRHLQDVSNLYRSGDASSCISATIEFRDSELRECLKSLDEMDAPAAKKLLRRRSELSNTLTITRNLQSNTYTIDSNLVHEDDQDKIARHIVSWLPYILYFDDFRDSVDEKVEIKNSPGDTLSGWLAILQRLFESTDEDYSVFDLAGLEERRRKGVLAKVKRHLNAALTKEWQSFRLDDTDALQISLDFYQEQASPPAPGAKAPTRSFLKLEVIETDSQGNDHYFYVRDRSKGFYWFFNFVMKLEFNPKLVRESPEAIYLLDEPGSYLHASAQTRLCQKLKKLSNSNKVVYCTHSHYLLDPEVIPLSAIRVAEKDIDGSVTLATIHNLHTTGTERRSAFQPIVDALRIKPFALDLNCKRALIVEGIVDYFILDMFKKDADLTIIPSVGADSIQYYISLMIGWGIPYCALWDNDKKGQEAHAAATKAFGDLEAQNRFLLLPSVTRAATIIQNYVDGDDLAEIRKSLNLPNNVSFDKTISSLFYHAARNSVLASLRGKTRDSVVDLHSTISRVFSSTARES